MKYALHLMACMTALLSVSSHAIEITPTNSADHLFASLFAGGGAGIDLNSVQLTVHSNGAGSSSSVGTFTNSSGTYGTLGGIVLSTGSVADYADGANEYMGNSTQFYTSATQAQNQLLDPITGGQQHYDVTQIDLTFNLLPGFDSVFFNVVFGSEEYEQWVGTEFIDAFGLYINGENVAFLEGAPVNINHQFMELVAGTELNGLLGGSSGEFGPYVHTFGAVVGEAAQSVTLSFIIADSGDMILDSTAFISQLGAVLPSLPPQTPPPNDPPDYSPPVDSPPDNGVPSQPAPMPPSQQPPESIPNPATIWLFLMSGGLLFRLFLAKK